MNDIAIVSNSHTPYRLHLHRRIALEIPQIRLWSLYTHETSNAPWTFTADDQTNPIQFGKGESSDMQSNPKYSLREWRRGGRIIQWMSEHHIRFILMMGYNDAGRVRMIRWSRQHGIPCWLFGDSNILGDRTAGIKAMIKKPIVRRVVGWCDGVFSCGRLGKEYFVKYGADPNRCFYFPYEPDYELIQNLSTDRLETVRQRFSLDNGRRRIVFSGRLATVKRPDLLIDAFAAIAARRPQWDLLLIGDGPLRQSLQSRLPADLSPRVTWTGFLDDQATVSALYRLSDVLVLPSDYEPWALVINEAAAAGLAIVSSSVVGAAAELLRDGLNGRLFPPGNITALIDSLLDVTDAAKTDAMKAASAGVLADWRQRGDPVQGLRNALSLCGLI
jgi:glycosyltransferase involved in cell wall biosynthesis